MGRITLKQAAQWCGGQVDPKYEEISFLGACNDTRKLKEGQLFLALQGQRDGHRFISAALEAGAAAVLCTHADGDFPAIVVDDTRKALGEIAREERNRLGMKVLGITGSVGKSTTKEMAAALLSKKYRVGKTPVNHNNDIGMPMAILSMPEDTEVAVLEMGMNHFGEMSYLTSIAQPDVALINNIGTAHIENLGCRDGILRAKLEILEGLRENGTVILNGDEPLLWNLREKIQPAPVYFGMENENCAVKGIGYAQELGSCSFGIETAEHAIPVHMPVEGLHFAMDALAAATAALTMGVSLDQIACGLAEFQSMEGRQEIFKARGCTIIKDCYNAGPESMAASLGVLGCYPGRRIAVLGDMLELGASAQAQHYRIGRIAATKSDLILTIGENASRVVGGAITGGMRPDRAIACTTKEELAEILRHRANPGDTILVKGSRGMRMEQVLELFLKEK